jgi:hypothetical protein
MRLQLTDAHVRLLRGIRSLISSDPALARLADELAGPQAGDRGVRQRAMGKPDLFRNPPPAQGPAAGARKDVEAASRTAARVAQGSGPQSSRAFPGRDRGHREHRRNPPGRSHQPRHSGRGTHDRGIAGARNRHGARKKLCQRVLRARTAVCFGRACSSLPVWSFRPSDSCDLRRAQFVLGLGEKLG